MESLPKELSASQSKLNQSCEIKQEKYLPDPPSPLEEHDRTFDSKDLFAGMNFHSHKAHGSSEKIESSKAQETKIPQKSSKPLGSSTAVKSVSRQLETKQPSSLGISSMLQNKMSSALGYFGGRKSASDVKDENPVTKEKPKVVKSKTNDSDDDSSDSDRSSHSSVSEKEATGKPRTTLLAEDKCENQEPSEVEAAESDTNIFN